MLIHFVNVFVWVSWGIAGLLIAAVLYNIYLSIALTYWMEANDALVRGIFLFVFAGLTWLVGKGTRYVLVNK